MSMLKTLLNQMGLGKAVETMIGHIIILEAEKGQSDENGKYNNKPEPVEKTKLLLRVDNNEELEENEKLEIFVYFYGQKDRKLKNEELDNLISESQKNSAMSMLANLSVKVGIGESIIFIIKDILEAQAKKLECDVERISALITSDKNANVFILVLLDNEPQYRLTRKTINKHIKL